VPGAKTSQNPEESRIDINIVENGFSTNLLYYDGRIRDEPVRVLVDGGSMGNFVSNAVVRRLHLKVSDVRGQTIAFANGETSICNKETYSVPLELSSHRERIHLKVVNLPSHDVILGKP